MRINKLSSWSNLLHQLHQLVLLSIPKRGKLSSTIYRLASNYHLPSIVYHLPIIYYCLPSTYHLSIIYQSSKYFLTTIIHRLPSNYRLPSIVYHLTIFYVSFNFHQGRMKQSACNTYWRIKQVFHGWMNDRLILM